VWRHQFARHKCHAKSQIYKAIFPTHPINLKGACAGIDPLFWQKKITCAKKVRVMSGATGFSAFVHCKFWHQKNAAAFTVYQQSANTRKNYLIPLKTLRYKSASLNLA
jgi:hypothetical protein